MTAVILGRTVNELASAISLRRVLAADAIISGVAAIAMVVGAGPLGNTLGLSTALLRWTGLVLLPWVALLAHLATRERLGRPVILAVVGANLLWAIASILLLMTGWVEPTAVGYAFVIVQALAVALIAELQYVCLRNASPMVA
jgi:hypothetical protein